MQAKRINNFLADITANNNREWFLEHKEEYMACRASFEEGIASLQQYPNLIQPLLI